MFVRSAMIWFCKAAVAHFNQVLMLWSGFALCVIASHLYSTTFFSTRCVVLLPVSAKQLHDFKVLWSTSKVKKLKYVIWNTPFDLLYEEITGVSNNINYTFILFEDVNMSGAGIRAPKWISLLMLLYTPVLLILHLCYVKSTCHL